MTKVMLIGTVALVQSAGAFAANYYCTPASDGNEWAISISTNADGDVVRATEINIYHSYVTREIPASSVIFHAESKRLAYAGDDYTCR